MARREAKLRKDTPTAMTTFRKALLCSGLGVLLCITMLVLTGVAHIPGILSQEFVLALANKKQEAVTVTGTVTNRTTGTPIEGVEEVFIDPIAGSDVTGQGTDRSPWSTIGFAISQVEG